MKVLMICGSCPPDVCGVGHYALRLVNCLRAKGLVVSTLTANDLNLRSIVDCLRTIKSSGSNVVHIQYPSVGYGMSMRPQIASLFIPAVVTLHEFSHVRVPRKLATMPFLWFAKHIVFTSQYELDYAKRLFPWIIDKSSVIPIGSNIDPIEQSDLRRNVDEVIYFGLVAPRKGLEEVIELAKRIREAGLKLKVRVVGHCVDAFSGYADELRWRSRNLPIIWTLGLSDEEVAHILSTTSVAYLPFPDGASDRRGSLRAVLASGVACVSTVGRQTHHELSGAFVHCENPADALGKIRALLSDTAELQRWSDKGRNISKAFSWKTISKEHVDLYRSLIDGSEEHVLDV